LVSRFLIAFHPHQEVALVKLASIPSSPALKAATAIPVLMLLSVAGPMAAQTSDVRYGDSVEVGSGVARTYVAYDSAGRATEIGIALFPDALLDLPEPGGDSTIGSVFSWDLPFPEGTPAPYRFASLDWNPLGHIPPGIYDVPHFDFHFYMISPEERDAIVPDDPEYSAKATRLVDASLLPAGYVLPPDGTVPRMGSHWVDPASHEFHGQPFTSTFLYGSWDGRLVFLEPMITLAVLEGPAGFSADITLPERVPVKGSYPTKYVVRRDDASGEIRVALTDLTERD
jgi:hypothetical protein